MNSELYVENKDEKGDTIKTTQEQDQVASNIFHHLLGQLKFLGCLSIFDALFIFLIENYTFLYNEKPLKRKISDISHNPMLVFSTSVSPVRKVLVFDILGELIS